MNLLHKLTPLEKFRLSIMGLMLFLGGGLFFLTICVCVMLMNDTIRTPPEPLEYKVIEFSACSGWDNMGSAEKQQAFQSNEQVFACGRIETNYPILLSVYWEYEGQQIYRDIIRDVKDQFLSDLTPAEKEFPPGNYEVKLVIGKDIEGSSKFTVQAQEGSNP